MSKILNNTTNLQEVLEILQTKAAGGSGTDTSDATATASDLLKDKTAYVDGEKITGTIETKTSSDLTASGATVTIPSGYYVTQATKSVATATQATPTVSVDANGKITASATQNAGYVAAGTKTGTKQLTTKGATTYTPTTTNQTISSGTYLTGTQTIKGDANLVGANIVSGKSIFGVAGTATIGTNISDATATADEIFAEETAYTANGKVTGTFTIQDELTEQNDLIQQISTLVATKANPQGGTDTSDATATAEDILSGKTAYVKGEKITGTYEASGGGSGGGSVETWTGTISPMGIPMPLTVYYTDSSMTLQMKDMSEGTIEVAANTIIFIDGNICEARRGCIRLGGGTGSYAYQIISNDFLIVVPM